MFPISTPKVILHTTGAGKEMDHETKVIIAVLFIGIIITFAYKLFWDWFWKD